MALCECGERLVEHAVPDRALLDAEPVAVQIGPRRKDLAVDSGLVHARDTLLGLLDQLGEERTQPQAIRELQRVTGRLGLDERDAVARALVAQPLDERGWHVMRVDVDHRESASARRCARFLGDSRSARAITPLAAQ